MNKMVIILGLVVVIVGVGFYQINYRSLPKPFRCSDINDYVQRYACLVEKYNLPVSSCGETDSCTLDMPRCMKSPDGIEEVQVTYNCECGVDILMLRDLGWTACGE